MKKTTILLVMALLCLNICAKAQNQTNILPLKIGEKLPETFWQLDHVFFANGKLLRQNLSAYKGKLLIIDFFATWCGTCIGKLQLMEGLQSENKGDYNFLLLSAKNTGDTPDKIKALQERLKLGILKTSVVNDSTLNKLFPHKTVPTYIWISESGVLQAVTNSAMLNQLNIDLLKAKKKPISNKKMVATKPDER